MRLQKSPSAGNRAVEKYAVFEGFPAVESQVRFIGPLKGSWREMGVQYGAEAGDLIRWVYDAWWINAGNILSEFGKSHLLEDLHRYERSIYLFSPQLAEFMGGIAAGASDSLSKSIHANECTHYEKILLINVCTSLVWNHPPSFRHTDDKVRKTGRIWPSGEGRPQSARTGGEGCSHFAITGKSGGTKSRKTFHAHSRETEFCPWNYNVFFVAIPDEPGTKTWWTLAMAGQLSGNMAGNILGVSIGSSAGAITPVGESQMNERAFGVPISSFRTYAAAYSNSALEAASFFMTGTEEYRTNAKRESLLRDFGNNLLFSDKNECIVVEATACRYGIRKPGENGETGDYIVAANHQYCIESYDENNVKTNISMRSFRDETSNPTSATRFWTLMWMIKNHFGDIDESMIMNEFMNVHYFFDKEGRRHNTYALDPFGKIPAHHAGATVCRHLPGYPDPFSGGSNDVKLFSLDDKVVYWAQGRPCEWQGPWDQIALDETDGI